MTWPRGGGLARIAPLALATLLAGCTAAVRPAARDADAAADAESAALEAEAAALEAKAAALEARTSAAQLGARGDEEILLDHANPAGRRDGQR